MWGAPVLGILILVVLFLTFPFITREHAGGCSGQGCWKKTVGFGCGDCPADRPGAPDSDHAA